jgi:hypothetical protein
MVKGLVWSGILIVFVAFALPTHGFGQGGCSIVGDVEDSSNGILVNANVELRSASSPEVRTAQTDSQGRFQFSEIPCGEYVVRAMMPDFSVASMQVDATLSAVTRISIKLGVATITVSPEKIYVAPTWNAWAETSSPDSAPSFRPEKSLRPQTDYTLNVDLSGFSYGDISGLVNKPVSSEILDYLNRSKQHKVSLDVLIIPDPLSFDVQTDNDRHTRIEIDLDKLRRASKRSFRLAKAPLEILKTKHTPDFEFGRLRTHLRTTSRLGATSVAVSIWNHGTPIDEFIVPICVSQTDDETCPDVQVASYSLSGNESVGGLTKESAAPDAALQFIETDSTHLVGVFRCNHCRAQVDQGYRTWQMGSSAVDLNKFLSDTIMSEFNQAITDDDYYAAGKSIYWKIFSDRTMGGTVPEAAAFQKFLLDKDLAALPGGPSLFVRLLRARSEPLFLVPLGLMVVPEVQAKTPLAEHTRIEMPLENQIYDVPASCIDQWRLLVPDPNDQSTISSEVNKSFKPWNDSFKMWNGHAIVDEQDIPSFDSWLSSDLPLNAPTAVLIISHHERNRIFFNDDSKTPAIDSVHVQRRFSQPSLAILNACGTAGPGQADFVRQFNLRGVATVLASSYEVDARMAGLFVSSLMKHLRTGTNDHTYTISRAFFDAMRDVSTTPRDDNGGPPYGPRAYVFSLIGNGSLRVCVPPADTP